MGTLSFSDIYEQVETGAANGIAGGIYEVEVLDTRIRAADGKKLIFLDLGVLNGPKQGQLIQVTINFPNETAKPGAFFYFRQKIAGFQGPDLKAAFEAADANGSDEGALSIIADALKGKKVTAKVSLDESDGPYKGTNQLEETRALAGLQQPAQAPAPQAAPAPAAAPVESAPPAATPF